MTIWAEHFSKPALRILNVLGGALPFSLLEWGLLALLLWILPRPHRFRRLFTLLLSMLLMYALVWLPLTAQAKPDYAANERQIFNSCETLIKTMNASEPDFSDMPNNLPAKVCAFPFWMRALKLSGFYSFFTGEALISPDVPSCAAPFTAVHEAMHSRGVADEGLCNIAAYEDCLARGGVYADSARLWALRYSMGAVKKADFGAYYRLLCRMNPRVYALFREIGGAVCEGGGYEILASYLAAKERVC